MRFRFRAKSQLGRMILQLMSFGADINIGEMQRYAQRLTRRYSWRVPLTAGQIKTLQTIARASGGYDFRTNDPVDPLVDAPVHLEAVPVLVGAGLLTVPTPGLGTPLASQQDATPVRLTAAGVALIAASDALAEVKRLRDIIRTTLAPDGAVTRAPIEELWAEIIRRDEAGALTITDPAVTFILSQAATIAREHGEDGMTTADRIEDLLGSILDEEDEL